MYLVQILYHIRQLMLIHFSLYFETEGVYTNM